MPGYTIKYTGVDIESRLALAETAIQPDDLGTAAAAAATDFAPAAKGVTNGDSHDHLGGDGAQIAYSSLSGLPTLGTAAATASTAYATAAQGTAAEQYRIDVDTNGFVDENVAIAFDPAGNTSPNNGLFTLGTAGQTFYYYMKGVRCAITGTKTVVVPDATATTTTHFVYFASGVTNGTLTCTTEPWNLYNDGKVPVATITRNSTLTPAYVYARETHTCLWMRRHHMFRHFSGGATYASGGVITGLTATTDSLAAITPAVTPIKWFDEDLYQTTAAITDANGVTSTPYTILYKTGLNTWAWKRSLVPFKYTGAGFIETTNNTSSSIGGVAAWTTGAHSSAGSNNYCNYFMLAGNWNGQESIVFIPGQSVMFTSSTTAYAESWASINLAGCPLVDAVAVAMFTYRLNGGQLGKVTLARLPVAISGNIVTSTVTPSTAHNTLVGLQGGDGTNYHHLPNGTTDNDLATWNATTGLWESKYLTSGNAAAGKVLTADGLGGVYWA